MTRSQRSRLLVWLAVTILGGAIGYAYTVWSYPLNAADGAPPLRGMRAGLMIAAATGGFEIFAMRGPVGRWLKTRPLGMNFLLRLLINSAIIVLLLQLNIRLVAARGFALAQDYRFSDLVADTLFSLAAMSAVLFVLQMRQLVGPRLFAKLLAGRYLQPREEERIFVILDIVGSSLIAGRIGNQAFHRFVSRVFFDIDAPIVDHGGEVISFVGDALIAGWPLGGRERNGEAVAAVFAALDTLERHAAGYRDDFGLEPHMRAVIHGGPVVAGETGDSRRQITYLGDVLNMASRIEQKAKELGASVVISDSLLARTDLPGGVTARRLCAFTPRGGSGPLAVCALEREAG